MTELLLAILFGAVAAGLYLGAVWCRARICLGRPLLVLLTYPVSLLCAAGPLAVSGWLSPGLFPVSALTLLTLRSAGLFWVAR